MNVYPFIEAERVERSNARRACVMLEVSRAAYYGWARQIPSARQSSDEALLAKIKDIHTASRGTYGSPAIKATAIAPTRRTKSGFEPSRAARQPLPLQSTSYDRGRGSTEPRFTSGAAMSCLGALAPNTT